MVLVSHDRYLLSSVCDDFYLVDSGEVSVFNGDLDDYRKWLFSTNATTSSGDDILSSDKNKAINSGASSSTTAGAKVQPEQDKKARKRLEAEFRKKMKPVKDEINKQEKRMDTAQTALSKLEIELSDTSLYEAENKANLTRVLAQQAQYKAELEEAEMLWLDAQEVLELANADFSEA
jgi:ATP-binding cassette subfamily F protein 3